MNVIECKHCKQIFTPTHFNQRLCSDDCKTKRNKKLCKRWDRNNKDKKKAYNARKYAEDKDHYRNQSSRERYGISLDEARIIQAKQNNKCAICEMSIDIDAPGINHTNKGHIDHCHESGKVRGILCRCCNWMLGSAKDRRWVLRRGVEYLDDHAE